MHTHICRWTSAMREAINVVYNATSINRKNSDHVYLAQHELAAKAGLMIHKVETYRRFSGFKNNNKYRENKLISSLSPSRRL